MAVYSIWESKFPPEASTEGRRVTQRIWDDMTRFDGYLGHTLLEDLDNAGHLLIVSRWSSRERADDVLAAYAEHPNALKVNRLVSSPRRRFLAAERHPR
ncbi:MAG: antibiotic biosynthesis monooxygenase [Candidatus Dormibacteria bacterium]